MYYNGRFITILTICVIIYSFYYYNKDSNTGVRYTDSAKAAPRYKMEIDPQRTDLSWYEKLILRYALNKKKKQERREAERLETQHHERLEVEQEQQLKQSQQLDNASKSIINSCASDDSVSAANTDTDTDTDAFPESCDTDAEK